MRLVLWVLAVLALLLPFALIGGLMAWTGEVMTWKQQFRNMGVKLPAQDQFRLDLADFAHTYLPAIGILIVAVCWMLAIGLGALAWHRRSPEARG